MSVPLFCGPWIGWLPLLAASLLPWPAPAADAASADLPGDGGHGRLATADGFWGGRMHEKLTVRGIHPYLSYTAETMGNISGGLRRGAVYDGFLEAGFRLELDKLAGWKGAQLRASMGWTHGASLSQKHLGDIFYASNIDAYDSVRLYEIWLSQRLWNERLELKVGHLASDREFLVSNLSSLFCNSTFGWPGVAGANINAPAFPLTTPGAKLAWQPHERLTVTGALFDGQPDPVDAQGNPLNKNGVRFGVNNHPLAIFELAYTPSPQAATTIKLGGWFHSGHHHDYRWDDAGRALADPASSGNPRGRAGNYGLYAMLDLALWREANDPAQGLALFTRTAFAPTDRNLISFYWDGGLHYTGLLPGRDEDEMGLGVAYGGIASHAQGAVQDQNFFGGGNEPVPDFELALELTYKARLKKWWTLQPDLQWIVHPGGSTAIPDAVVIGLRSTLSF